jgi:glycosyltransferase A (GT-A) superfamily protein (DUF2064 family)
MATDASIVIITKVPTPGYAKTRLASALGNEGAARLARASLMDVIDVVAQIDCRQWIGYSGASIWPESLNPHGFRCLRQSGSGLAERIARAMTQIAKRDGAAVTAMVTSDVPSLTAEQVSGLLEACSTTTPAALGLSPDGGFWGFAVSREMDPGLLTAVPMSTGSTGRGVIGAYRQAGVGVSVVDSVSDIDTVDDCHRVRAIAGDGRFARAWDQCLEGVATCDK